MVVFDFFENDAHYVSKQTMVHVYTGCQSLQGSVYFQRFFEYEALLDDIVTAVDPLLDSPPPHLPSLTSSNIREKLKTLPAIKTLLKSC